MLKGVKAQYGFLWSALALPSRMEMALRMRAFPYLPGFVTNLAARTPSHVVRIQTPPRQTLLVKSAPCNFHWHQCAFQRDIVSIFLRFKHGMSKAFPTNL